MCSLTMPFINILTFKGSPMLRIFPLERCKFFFLCAYYSLILVSFPLYGSTNERLTSQGFPVVTGNSLVNSFTVLGF